MMRFFLLLSVLTFYAAQSAHGQALIVIKQGDFAGMDRTAGTGPSTDAPLRIVPFTIGRRDPSLSGSDRVVPPGLLVPPIAATPASSLTTEANSGLSVTH